MKQLINQIFKSTIKNGGASYNLNGHSPSKGFMVATFGAEKKILLKDFNKKILKSYIKTHKKDLKGAFIGTWIDSNIVYLDISKKEKSKNKALEIARKNKQLAIFNLSNFESIYL